jgi:hypothetical protein
VIAHRPSGGFSRNCLGTSEAFWKFAGNANQEANMGAILLWLLGIPIPLILIFLLLAR